MRRQCKMKKVASVATFLIALTLLFPFAVPVAMAQATTGSLRGVVTDPTGAVIPDAEVTATEVSTGIETKTKSNGDGLYNLPRLNPGVYTLVVQRQGYKKQEFQQVNITIGHDTSIDVALQAGQLTETVT